MYIKLTSLDAANDAERKKSHKKYNEWAVLKWECPFLEGSYGGKPHQEVFLRNLLLNEKKELHNHKLHISGHWNDEKVDIEEPKVDIEKK